MSSKIYRYSDYKDKIPVRNNNVIWAWINEDKLEVLDTISYKLYRLNKTAGLIWENIDGFNTISDIAKKINEIFPEIDEKIIKKDILKTIITFLNEGLVCFK